MQDWFVGDVTVPSGDDLTTVFESPIFTYDHPDFNCGYFWNDYALISMVDARGFDLLDTEEFIELDAPNLSLLYQSQIQYTDVVLKVTMIARLSDLETQVTTTFTVTF